MTEEGARPPWPLFRLGTPYVTASALRTLSHEDILRGLRRHARGDWGELCKEDKAQNDRALLNGNRLLSAYRSSSGVRYWIITERDRSVTTILLPDDY